MANQPSLSLGRSPSKRWRTVLQVIAVVVAVEIALHSFIVREPLITLVLASLWLAGFFLTCSVVVRAGRDSLRIRRSGRWHNYSYLDNRRARASRVRGSDRRGDDAQGAKHASVIDATPFGVAHSPGQVRRAHDPWRRGGTNAESYEIGVAFNRFVLTLLPSADQV